MNTRLRIKHFGPIQEGFTDTNGWLEINKLTILIGNQGSGKSTVAKVFSTLSWLEKALVRGQFKERGTNVEKLKELFTYQNIEDYFKPNSLIEYEGSAYYIYYSNQQLSISKSEKNGYHFPKIMYIPSERNLVSTVTNVRKLEGLPQTLYTFADEYFKAADYSKSSIDIPLNNIKFDYPTSDEPGKINGEDFTLELPKASSGLQSFIPLYVVLRYLNEIITTQLFTNVADRNLEKQKLLREEIRKIYSNPSFSEQVKEAMLEEVSKKFIYDALINIIEEPEQNLFPDSQNKLLDVLFSFNNSGISNKLIITTHSPYLIGYTGLAIQAGELRKKVTDPKVLERLFNIIPHTSTLEASEVVIYQLDEKTGTIDKLSSDHGIPSGENYLNLYLQKGNELFDYMLEIEQEMNYGG
jgi:predicted ATPase